MPLNVAYTQKILDREKSRKREALTQGLQEGKKGRLRMERGGEESYNLMSWHLEGVKRTGGR